MSNRPFCVKFIFWGKFEELLDLSVPKEIHIEEQNKDYFLSDLKALKQL